METPILSMHRPHATPVVTVAGAPFAHQHFANVAQFVRARCETLLTGDDAAAFDLAGGIDLRGGGGLAGDYEKGSIITVRYARGAVPPDETLHVQPLQNPSTFLSVWRGRPPS